VLTQERAREVWEKRAIQNRVDHLVTPEEDACVRRLWETMPGTTCWMDAFHRIRLGRDLPAAW
jgi:hypothetical protein